MSASAVEILRRQLREKFPQAMAVRPKTQDGKTQDGGGEESCVVREEVSFGAGQEARLSSSFSLPPAAPPRAPYSRGVGVSPSCQWEEKAPAPTARLFPASLANAGETPDTVHLGRFEAKRGLGQNARATGGAGILPAAVLREVRLGRLEGTVLGETPTLLEFPAGTLSEVVAAGPAAGLALVIAGLLGEPTEICPHPEMALIDGADGFDPASFSAPACTRLLWVRCRTALEMVKAADWLVRDGNLPLVLLDATGLEPRELLALPASAWWRLKQGAEQSGCRLVVLAPLRLVAAARVRLSWSAELRLDDFDARREDLWPHLRQESARRRQLNH